MGLLFQGCSAFPWQRGCLFRGAQLLLAFSQSSAIIPENPPPPLSAMADPASSIVLARGYSDGERWNKIKQVATLCFPAQVYLFGDREDKRALCAKHRLNQRSVNVKMNAYARPLDCCSIFSFGPGAFLQVWSCLLYFVPRQRER